jgi:DNA-binding beta-propeller fold protein YncE
MSAATRRGFLAGTLAGTVAPALARGATASTTIPHAERPVVRRGRAIAVSADGRRLIVAHDERHTVGIVTRGRTRLVELGGQPLGVALSPGGTVAAVTTAFWDGPGLTLLDAATGKALRRRALGPAPGDVAFTPDGRRLLVAGGEQEGTLHVLETGRYGTVVRAEPGRVPRAVVPTHDGRAAWISLDADDRVALVDLVSGRIRRELRTPALPDRLALSPDGERLLISHGGREASRVTELELASGHVHRHAAGRLPSAVAWTRSGRRLVALGGEAAVLRLGGPRHPVGAAPRGLAVAGRRFWTVSALTGAIDEGRA